MYVQVEKLCSRRKRYVEQKQPMKRSWVGQKRNPIILSNPTYSQFLGIMPNKNNCMMDEGQKAVLDLHNCWAGVACMKEYK
jgi:hypothetical protein